MSASIIETAQHATVEAPRQSPTAVALEQASAAPVAEPSEPKPVQAHARTESVPPATTQETQANSGGFFERNTDQRREIIEGLIREQQLVAFAGPYGIGKSPTLADIAMQRVQRSGGEFRLRRLCLRR